MRIRSIENPTPDEVLSALQSPEVGDRTVIARLDAAHDRPYNEHFADLLQHDVNALSFRICTSLVGERGIISRGRFGAIGIVDRDLPRYDGFLPIRRPWRPVSKYHSFTHVPSEASNSDPSNTEAYLFAAATEISRILNPAGLIQNQVRSNNGN